MIAWFESLPVLEQIFFYIALPATLILIIQMLTLFLGNLGGGSGDVGLDSDVSGLDLDTDSGGLLDDAVSSADSDLDVADSGDGSLDVYGLRFITLRGIIAFFTVAGWSGVCCVELGVSPAVSVVVSIALGSAALVGIAYLVRVLLRLQESGNMDYRRALGQIGDVYIPIPAAGQGMGKITLSLEQGFWECDAITGEEEEIKTGTVVRVVDIVRGNIMVVERENSDYR